MNKCKKVIFKRIFSIVGAIFLFCATFFIPFSMKNKNYASAASSSTAFYTSNYSFLGLTGCVAYGSAGTTNWKLVDTAVVDLSGTWKFNIMWNFAFYRPAGYGNIGIYFKGLSHNVSVTGSSYTSSDYMYFPDWYGTSQFLPTNVFNNGGIVLTSSADMGSSVSKQINLAYFILPPASSNYVEPSLNMVRLYKGNYTSDFVKSYSFVYNSDLLSGVRYNYLCYVDSAGWTYFIMVSLKNTASDTFERNPYFYFQDFSCYLNVDLSDNSYYEQGYDDGYSTGNTDGQSIGYNNGYNAGKSDGYNNGYNAGLQAGNDYSFLGLMSAVVDAPISIFTGLLNFELLGVNVLDLVTGLLTFAVVIFVVSLILGKKGG